MRKVYFSFYMWFSKILLDEFNHVMLPHGTRSLAALTLFWGGGTVKYVLTAFL